MDFEVLAGLFAVVGTLIHATVWVQQIRRERSDLLRDVLAQDELGTG